MNLIHRLNLLLLFFFCMPVLLAQSCFKPGYIITNENDTIHGLIDYRGDSRNSKKCSFKENVNSVVKEFHPDDILGYRFNDSKYYISKNVIVKGSETRLFIEFLVNGIANLYFYREDNLPRYYIEKSDGKLIELSDDEVEIKKDGTPYLWKTNRYLGSLRSAFADCPQLSETINYTTLDTKSLVNITKKYHNYICVDQKCIIYEKQLPAIKLTLAPFASLNVSSLDLQNGRNQYENIEYQNTSYPSIGVLLNTTMPRANEKLSFQVSAEAGKSYFYGTGAYTYGKYNSFNEVHLHSTLLMGKGGFKYTYPTGKIRPTIMAGVHVAALINKKGKRIEKADNRPFEYAEDVFADYNFGPNLDLGINYHKFKIFTPFMAISFSSSSGESGEWLYPVYTKLKTLCISAGIYF